MNWRERKVWSDLQTHAARAPPQVVNTRWYRTLKEHIQKMASLQEASE